MADLPIFTYPLIVHVVYFKSFFDNLNITYNTLVINIPYIIAYLAYI